MVMVVETLVSAFFPIQAEYLTHLFSGPSILLRGRGRTGEGRGGPWGVGACLRGFGVFAGSGVFPAAKRASSHRRAFISSTPERF